MKNRLLVLWLALLTVYVSYTSNDVYRVLKNVETGQYYTLKYMEKSVPILSQLKHSPHHLQAEESMPNSASLASK